jgi:hypothetical protein
MEKKALLNAAVGLAGAGFLVEAEKMAGMPIREHLGQPYNWPFIYGSDLAPATIVGIFAGMVGSKAGYVFEKKRERMRQAIAIATSSLVAAAPITLGTGYELMNKCPIEKTDKYSPELRKIHVCRPDAIDASTVMIGGLIGIVGGIAMNELDMESRRKKIHP